MPDGTIMTAAAQTAGELAIQTVENEPRILDLDLAERLGFAKPTKIRDLIKRHKPALEAMGPLPTVGRVINGGGATEFYLNRQQALFLTMKSETQTAIKVTTEVIRRFDAYERGAQPKPATAPAFDFRDPNALLELSAQLTTALAERQGEVKALQVSVAVLEPKAAAWDRIADASGLVLLSDYAKAAALHQGRLFDIIEYELKWCFRRVSEKGYKSPLVAKQQLIDRGWLATKMRQITRADTSIQERPQVYLTPPGFKRLSEILLERGHIYEAPKSLA
jgi:phage antirepressor YoqD-like protein